MCGRGGAAAVGNRHVGRTWDDEFAAGVQCSRAAGHHQILPDLSTKHTNKHTHTTTQHASSHSNRVGVIGSSGVILMSSLLATRDLSTAAASER